MMKRCRTAARTYPGISEVAAEESAVTCLRLALRKAIVNALQRIILPRLEQQIRPTVESIDEEERDEAVRRKIRMAVRASSAFGDSRPGAFGGRTPQ